MKLVFILLLILIVLILQSNCNINESFELYLPQVLHNGRLREIYRYFISKGVNPTKQMLENISNY